jgi:hypothetical protein
MNRTTDPRCVECHRPVSRTEPKHSWTGAAGTRAGLVHREVTYVRHAACQARVEQMNAQTAARAETERLATVRAMAEAAGLSPAQVSDIARDMGAPDPYADELDAGYAIDGDRILVRRDA